MAGDQRMFRGRGGSGGGRESDVGGGGGGGGKNVFFLISIVGITMAGVPAFLYSLVKKKPDFDNIDCEIGDRMDHLIDNAVSYDKNDAMDHCYNELDRYEAANPEESVVLEIIDKTNFDLSDDYLSFSEGALAIALLMLALYGASMLMRKNDNTPAPSPAL